MSENQKSEIRNQKSLDEAEQNQKSEIRNQKSLDEAERNQKSEIRNQKSLDEVIEQYEYCLAIGESACGGCRYRDKDGVCRMRENALPYLKQYRSDKAMWEADRKGYQDWIEQYKDARDKHQQAVIELKRKLLAKVINIHPVGKYLFGSCGGCGASVIKPDVYCSSCGAKLDWSEK